MPTRCYEANARHAVQYVIRGGAHRSPRLVGAPLYCAWCARGAVLGQQPLDILHGLLARAHLLPGTQTLTGAPSPYPARNMVCLAARLSWLARRGRCGGARDNMYICNVSAAVVLPIAGRRESSPENVRVGSAALAASAISAGMFGLAG